MGIWNHDELAKMTALIQKASLPSEIPDYMKTEMIIDAMKLDKKARGGNIEMVLPQSIGEMTMVGDGYGVTIEEAIIEKVI